MGSGGRRQMEYLTGQYRIPRGLPGSCVFIVKQMICGVWGESTDREARHMVWRVLLVKLVRQTGMRLRELSRSGLADCDRVRFWQVICFLQVLAIIFLILG